MHKIKQLLLNRIMAVLLVVLMLLPSIPVFAVSGSSVSVGTASGQPGDQVSVTVSVSGNPGIAYLKLKIGYDASQLTLTGATNSGLLSGTFTTSKTTDTNPYVLQWMGAENATGNGVAATLTFQIASNASAGDKAISVSVDECYNESFDDVTLSTSNGKVTVNTTSPKVLSSISVSSMPTKKTYNIGESLDTTGLTIKLTYSDGSTEIISSGFTTSGFSSTSIGTKAVTVSYGGKSTSFSVVVNNSNSHDCSGTTGSCYWYLDGSVLTIYGNGPMGDYGAEDNWGTLITEIIILEGVTRIGACSFDECSYLTSVTIPNTVTEIGGTAFWGCSSLSSIDIPNSVKTIGSAAFRKCSSLTKATIPDSVTELGGDSFSDCTSLKEVVLSKNMTTINRCTFTGCTSLESMTIPDNVTSIGDSAFGNCISLEKLSLSSNLQTMGSNVFHNCENLTEVQIPNRLNEIPYGTFTSCSRIESIGIPNSVTKIGNFAFQDCSNLSTVNYDGTKSQWDNISIGSYNSPLTLAKKNYLQDPTEPNPQLVSIAINKMPDKTAYFVGETLDTTGLQLMLTYSDGSTSYVNSQFTTSGFISTSAGTKTVTVSYQGKTTTFNVTVNTPSISLSSTSKSMTAGDTTTLTATTTPSGQTVTWTSSNTSVATVSGGTITAKSAGTAIITAKFTYNGITYSKTCNVTVTSAPNPEPTLSSISIATKPTKTTYEIGESLNISGLTLKLSYSDGSTETVSSGFTTSGFNSTTAGIKTITVSYSDKTTTFNVTVKANDTLSAKYSIESATNTSGSNVEIYVSIEENPGIISLRNEISYDTSALDLIKIEDLGLLAGYTAPSPTISSPYTLRWADSLATENNQSNGNLVKLTFRIKEDTEIGDYNISVIPVEARNVTGEKVEFEEANSTITVIDYLVGDVDNDGEITDWDAIVLNRYLSGWNEKINNKSADIDGDGDVTDWDAIVLERYLAGWDVEIG